MNPPPVISEVRPAPRRPLHPLWIVFITIGIIFGCMFAFRTVMIALHGPPPPYHNPPGQKECFQAEINDRILLGDYTFQNEKPLDHVKKVQDLGIQTPTLFPFFAPKANKN